MAKKSIDRSSAGAVLGAGAVMGLIPSRAGSFFQMGGRPGCGTEGGARGTRGEAGDRTGRRHGSGPFLPRRPREGGSRLRRADGQGDGRPVPRSQALRIGVLFGHAAPRPRRETALLGRRGRRRGLAGGVRRSAKAARADVDGLARKKSSSAPLACSRSYARRCGGGLMMRKSPGASRSGLAAFRTRLP